MPKKILAMLFPWCFLLSGVVSARAQAQAPEPAVTYPAQLMTELASLRDEAFRSDYAHRQVAHLSENIGPRMGGSPQAEQAAEYVAAEMRKLGLDAHLEEVRLPRWVRGAETAELVQFPGQAPQTTQKILVTTLSGSTSTSPAGLTAEVIAVNNFDELKQLGRAKVAGKIVLFNFPFDKQKAAAGSAGEAYGEAVAYRVAAGKSGADLGAVASLVRSVGGADYRLPHTGYSLPSGIPQGAVAAEDADLISHLAAQGPVRLHLTLTPQVLPEVIGHNVIGDLKGSEHPEQIVVVSGHLDSWDLGTGALDDAAGVAVAMEVAHLVQQLHLHPKRTIRVIAWIDEENGGRGHDAYEKAHGADYPNYVAAMESDLGAGHCLGYIVKASAKAIALMQPVQAVMQGAGANVLRPTNSSPGSDISPMVRAGIPGLAPLQDARTYFNYHHTAADTLDKIVPRELQENAAAMAVMAYALADMPETLPR